METHASRHALVVSLGLVLLATVCCVPLSRSARDVTMEGYLQQFGYLDKEGAPPNLGDDVMMTAALREFQKMAGLPMTGQMTRETMEMMRMPRCGNRDLEKPVYGKRRRRYKAEGSKWPRNNVTYSIINYSTDMQPSVQLKEIQRAFDLWASYTPLRFTRTSGRADIEISFGRLQHGDPYPFDGPGLVLAHAFFPQYGGEIHMDDDEFYTSGTFSGTNFFQVFIHELGHSLGLSHSQYSSALMAPFYTGYQPNFRLHSDDIAGIRSIYGAGAPPTARPTQRPTQSPTQRPTQSPTQSPGGASSLCPSGHIDTFTRVDGRISVFRGDEVSSIDPNTFQRGAPRKINQVFPGLPDNLDAAVYWPADYRTQETTYFFKGNMYWRYSDGRLLTSGYPRRIEDAWRGLPDDVDAAFVFQRNGQTYFIKDDLYYSYSRDTGVGSAKSLTLWPGLPMRVDAAFQSGPIGPDKESFLYFFHGGDYYRFNETQFRVDAGYPKKTAKNWLYCGDTG